MNLKIESVSLLQLKPIIELCEYISSLLLYILEAISRLIDLLNSTTVFPLLVFLHL